MIKVLKNELRISDGTIVCSFCNRPIKKDVAYEYNRNLDEDSGEEYDFPCHCSCVELANVCDFGADEDGLDSSLFWECVFDMLYESDLSEEVLLLLKKTYLKDFHDDWLGNKNKGELECGNTSSSVEQNQSQSIFNQRKKGTK